MIQVEWKQWFQDAGDEDGDDGVKVTRVTNCPAHSTIVQDLIEMTMKKMDQDRDGRVSYSDFMATVTEVVIEYDVL